MAESTKVQLKDVAGTPVYPVTTADQVKTADGGNVEAEIKALKALLASGVRPCGTVGAGGDMETLPADSYKRGDMYIVKTGGTYAGQVCEPGDLILCIKTFEEEAADTDWTVIQNNIDRAVKGPESAADGNLMAFDGTSGTVAKDSGIKLTDVSAAVAQKHSHDNAVLLASISADGETATINGKTFYAGLQVAVIEAGGEIPAGMSPTGIVFEKVADGPAA
ncbi:MAG TPA: hypothetical protein H9774_00865 [Candidatus Desulfovibrio gallistercoris]|nr:hypothetical protein [Candidatus Desulfovibrio gallistercoris]